MHILHLSTYLQGGAGLAICELACEQNRQGHAVSVAASRLPEADYRNDNEHLACLAAGGIPLHLVDSTFKRDLPKLLDAAGFLNDHLRESNSGVVHCHAAIPSLIALLARSSTPEAIPVVQTMHGWGIRKTPEQARADIQIMNRVDRVVAVSRALELRLKGLGVRPELLAVVANGIPDVPAEGERPESDPDLVGLLTGWRARGLRVLLCIGEVTQRKNQQFLVKCLDEVLPGAPLACLFIGGGEDLVELAREGGAPHLKDRIHFAGYRPKAWRFLPLADWLVLPSLDEGMPIAVLESFRAGIPVLGSSIPEIEELVEPGRTGLLFDPSSEADCQAGLAEAIRMPSSTWRKLGETARRKWEKYYRISTMARGYEEIYAALSGSGSSHRGKRAGQSATGYQEVN